MPTTNIGPLSQTEVGRLAHLEHIIERGSRAFAEVGRAAEEIRDGRLYRGTHRTFEAYCRARWNYGKSYVNMLIAAARVTTIVAVASEGVARELVPLLSTPRVMNEALAEAGERPTAAAVRQAVKRHLPAARAQGTIVPISAQSVLATMKDFRRIVRDDWTPKMTRAARLSPEGARFIASGLRQTADVIIALAAELERRNPPIGG